MRLTFTILIASSALLFTSINARPIEPDSSSSAALLVDESEFSEDNIENGRSSDEPFINDDSADDILNAASPSLRTVQVDRFAQMVATHWQFDHLDTIKTNSYDHIASQMRDHVEITMNPSPDHINNDNEIPQHTFSQSGPFEMMDLDILKAQIFGAIQAHVGGRLPIVWDELGDKLGRQAIETYVRRLAINHCGGNSNDLDEEEYIDQVDYNCLVDHGQQILAEIDRYVVRHLGNIFDIMNAEFLPELLQHTTKDLSQVLDYFNTAFLKKDDMQLSLRVLPWKQTEQRTHLHDFAVLARNSPDHQSDIVGYYANLARI